MGPKWLPSDTQEAPKGAKSDKNDSRSAPKGSKWELKVTHVGGNKSKSWQISNSSQWLRIAQLERCIGECKPTAKKFASTGKLFVGAAQI